ncbi:restriction endonuclease subunit S [Vibrio splendidus]
MSFDSDSLQIQDICTKVCSGGTPSTRVKEFYIDGTVPWIKTKEVNNCKVFSAETYITEDAIAKSSAKLIPENSVIIAMYGNGDTAGRVAINKIPVATNQACCNLIIDPTKADYRFVFYYLRTQYQKLVDLKNGGAQQNLNAKILREYPFPDTTRAKQTEIANFLEQLDDKISNNTQTNQTLEEMAQAIFKSWFVDFDPVKAKMNVDQPEGMDAGTASLFPEKLVESELGLIPEGWEVTKLSKVIDLLNGFAFKSPEYVKEGTFVLRTKNFDSSNSVERLGDDVYLPDEFLESHKKYLCEAYDYHVVMVAASIGKTAMIYPHQLPALRNQNMWCFRPKDESLRFYTKYMVDGLVKLNMGLASGSARAFFKKGDFNSYEFALPSSELLVKFNDVVGNLVKQKGSLLNQNVQLAAMRDTLLPKLLSGEIELDIAEVNLND